MSVPSADSLPTTALPTDTLLTHRTSKGWAGGQLSPENIYRTVSGEWVVIDAQRPDSRWDCREGVGNFSCQLVGFQLQNFYWRV